MEPIINKILNRIKRFLKEFYRVPYCVPAWGWIEHWAIVRCLFTGCIVKGKDKGTLYNLVRQKTGMKYVFGFNSGQEAITAALKAWGLGDNDKVIMPSYCCETVARAVVATGAQPLFCDIGDDYNPDVEHILKLIDNSVKAVIFPHLFGNPGVIDQLEHALEKKGIRSQILLIDDAAQSFGARLNNRLIGTFGDAGIISFGPGKTMTASGGGLLVTNNSIIADMAGSLPLSFFPVVKKLKKITYWIVFRRWRKFTLPFYPFLQFVFKRMQGDKGLIYSLCNIDAAIAVRQFDKLDDLINKRIDRKKKLDDLLMPLLSELQILPDKSVPELLLNVVTKYPIRFTNVVDDIQKSYQNFFSERSIEVQSLYKPIHFSDPYSSFHAVKTTILPRTEMLWDKILHIPVEPSINEDDFDLIINHFIEYKDFLIRSKYATS
jgi:perosamine synthetase